ncbi:MAG: hypothetical protein LBN27_09795 [Prevotellaceae bacterium]|jgi:hypothetical protein|nr:hypothetical protein [Prevotellaceae bacterium]GHT34153.1 hypothetical protein FACS189434_09820 [Bacteroidia bacterium]
MFTKELNSEDIPVFEGGEVVLKVGSHDFVLSEIARIIESENARVISLSTNFQSDGSALVTLKINTENLNTILKSLERYGYDIFSYVMHNAAEYDDTDRRFSEFLRYLEV